MTWLQTRDVFGQIWFLYAFITICAYLSVHIPPILFESTIKISVYFIGLEIPLEVLFISKAENWYPTSAGHFSEVDDY